MKQDEDMSLSDDISVDLSEIDIEEAKDLEKKENTQEKMQMKNAL